MSKQRIVALSSTEAELVAASEISKMILWIRALLKEFDFFTDNPTVMNMDNQVAIHCGRDGVRYAKHVDIRKNFLLHRLKQGNLRIEYCPTEHMLADMFAKSLMQIKFEENRKSIAIGLSSRGTSKKGISKICCSSTLVSGL